MALFRSAKGRARSERERTRIVESHLGDIPGDPGAWRPDRPWREMEAEQDSFWVDVARGAWFTLAVACAVIGAAFMVWMLALPAAHGRDLDGHYAQIDPQIRAWFNSLASRKGNCCSFADGRSITDADTDIRGNHFWVRVDGEWIEVPDDALVTAPNRIGTPVVWPMRDGQGKTAVRCFLPGSGA